MEGFFNIVGTFLGSLFVVAVAVAWWEHLRRTERPQPLPAEPPRAVRVDLDVAALAESPGDSPARQRALEGALERASAEPVPWVATTPTVAPGALSPVRATAEDRR